MEKVNAVLPRLNSQQTQTGSDETKKAINGVFGILKLQYPNFLNNQDESTAKRMWLYHLQSYSPELLEKAAKACPDHHPRFAPNIGEFKQVIREINTPRPEHQDIPRLSYQQSITQSVGNAALDKLREFLGMEKANREV